MKDDRVYLQPIRDAFQDIAHDLLRSEPRNRVAVVQKEHPKPGVAVVALLKDLERRLTDHHSPLRAGSTLIDPFLEPKNLKP
jgi:hypothetical protein